MSRTFLPFEILGMSHYSNDLIKELKELNNLLQSSLEMVNVLMPV